MVRPNQIIRSDIEGGTLTFLMFAQNEEQVKRRVLFINFPSTIRETMFGGDKEVDDFITDVTLVTEGMVNRHAVTVDTTQIGN